MKMLVCLLMTLLVVSLQSTVIPVLAKGSSRPDLVLLYVVSAGLVGGRENGVFYGLLGGLLQDLLSVGIFGVNTLSKMIIGLSVGLLERKFNKDNAVMPLVGIWAATALSQALSFLLLLYHGYGFRWELWGPSFLWVLLYHTVLILPMYWLLRSIFQQVDKMKSS